MSTKHSTKVPRILVIGDIAGADDYHVGDEAMVDANLSRIRSHIPNVQFTLVSRNPPYSAQLYGAEAIEPIGFAPIGTDSDAKNFARLNQVIKLAEQKAAGHEFDQAETSITQMVDAIFNVDGVLISGGGNLSSTWPQHLFERTALIYIASLLNKPVAISGQTIGPSLDDEHALLIARTLPLINLLGTRELDSMRLALSLGISPIKVEYQVDDAMHLRPEAPENAAEILKQPYVAVTLHTFAASQEEDQALAVLANQLDRIADQTGLHLVFIPHVGQDESGTAFSDLRVGKRLAGLLKNHIRMTVLDIENARRVVWWTQHAAMVISTRYHPLVFGLSGGVPCLAIYTDEYTRIKLQGALKHADLQQWSLPIKAALSDALFEAAAELWLRRDAIIEHLEIVRTLWRILDDRYEKRLLSALNLRASNLESAPELSDDLGETAATVYNPNGAWRSIIDAFIN
jgi:polysaccharide pyruvyl transferase WcaK-like protein